MKLVKEDQTNNTKKPYWITKHLINFLLLFTHLFMFYLTITENKIWKKLLLNLSNILFLFLFVGNCLFSQTLEHKCLNCINNWNPTNQYIGDYRVISIIYDEKNDCVWLDNKAFKIKKIVLYKNQIYVQFKRMRKHFYCIFTPNGVAILNKKEKPKFFENESSCH